MEGQGPLKATYASAVTNTITPIARNWRTQTPQRIRKKAKIPQTTLTETPQIPPPSLPGKIKIPSETDTEPNQTTYMDTAPAHADEDEDGRSRCSHMEEEENGRDRRQQKCPSKVAYRDDRLTNRYKKWPLGHIISCPL
jgi:hypothetical protein